MNQASIVVSCFYTKRWADIINIDEYIESKECSAML